MTKNELLHCVYTGCDRCHAATARSCLHWTRQNDCCKSICTFHEKYRKCLVCHKKNEASVYFGDLSCRTTSPLGSDVHMIYFMFAQPYLIFLTETSILITTHVSKIFRKCIRRNQSGKHFTIICCYTKIT